MSVVQISMQFSPGLEVSLRVFSGVGSHVWNAVVVEVRMLVQDGIWLDGGCNPS